MTPAELRARVYLLAARGVEANNPADSNTSRDAIADVLERHGLSGLLAIIAEGIDTIRELPDAVPIAPVEDAILSVAASSIREALIAIDSAIERPASGVRCPMCFATAPCPASACEHPGKVIP